jgi:hypothetical protein
VGELLNKYYINYYIAIYFSVSQGRGFESISIEN